MRLGYSEERISDLEDKIIEVQSQNANQSDHIDHSFV